MTFQARFLSRRDTIKVVFDHVIQTGKPIPVVTDPYNGPYEVTPMTIAQVLETELKNMRDDVTVKEIPYAETHNEHGVTVVIAS